MLHQFQINGPITDVPAIKEALLDAENKHRLQVKIHDAVCTVLESVHGKKATQAIATAVKAALPGMTIYLHKPRNDNDTMYLSIWSDAMNLPYNLKYEVTVAYDRAARDRFDYGLWREKHGLGYNDMGKSVAKYREYRNDRAFTQHVEKYNEALAALQEAAEYFDGISFAVWRK